MLCFSFSRLCFLLLLSPLLLSSPPNRPVLHCHGRGELLDLAEVLPVPPHVGVAVEVVAARAVRAALVLVAHRVARAALGAEDGLRRQLGVALVERAAVLVREALHVISMQSGCK